MRPRLRALLALSALAAGAAAVPSASAADSVYEVSYVESVDGALVRVEVMRPVLDEDVPVILTYSPYNSIGEPTPADDAVAARYVPMGYARAKADVIGTRGSTGCWDYGGAKEQQSGADVVRWLAEQEWSNGRVGMTGGSYDGTTATMVAALGDEIAADSNGGKGLAAIHPIAAISRWYGYAYMDGVRFLGNSSTPTDEGFDTPLLFDFGFGRTVAPGESVAQTAPARTGECGSVEHTERGYDRTPDYDGFWLERDYRKDAAAMRVPVLLSHGWQDYNVKQEEATALFEALPVDDPATAEIEGVPFKKLWMTQGTHSGGDDGAGYQELVDAFWERTLKGVDSGVEDFPDVVTVGRTAAGPTTPQVEQSWPPAGTSPLTLHLGRSFDTVPGLPPAGVATSTGEGGVLSTEPQDDGAGWTHIGVPGVTEEVVLRDLTNQGTKVGEQPVRSHGYAYLYHQSEPLADDVRIAGSALLETTVTAAQGGQTLTPILTEVLPNGTQKLVQRGFLNLDYAGGLSKADSTGGEKTATVRFLPQDYTFTEGSRIRLVLMGANTVWAVPGSGGLLSYDMSAAKGTRLVLPVVGDGSPVLPQPAASAAEAAVAGRAERKGHPGAGS
ncbi:MAG: CocE/NonD family hydrolase [Actinomycetes bacterium]